MIFRVTYHLESGGKFKQTPTLRINARYVLKVFASLTQGFRMFFHTTIIVIHDTCHLNNTIINLDAKSICTSLSEKKQKQNKNISSKYFGQ